MPFNEDYQQVMSQIRETGSEAAQIYAETHQNSAANDEAGTERTSVDWGKLANSFAGAAQEWIDSRNSGDGRKWNDFKVDARIDDSTQKTIILVVCILAGALIFYGIKSQKK